jgi:hypothetical protein
LCHGHEKEVERLGEVCGCNVFVGKRFGVERLGRRLGAVRSWEKVWG